MASSDTPEITRSLVAFLFSLSLLSAQKVAAEVYLRKDDWSETLSASRVALHAAVSSEVERKAAGSDVWRRLESDFPVACDWAIQDGGLDWPRWLTADLEGALSVEFMISKVLAELGEGGIRWRAVFERYRRDGVTADAPGWLRLYENACSERRALRLRTVLTKAPRIVFTKHRTIRPSFFAYTEGQSDAQNERHFLAGAELCLLELDGARGTVRTLLADPTGAIRDPAVSWDGERVLFAWKKSLNDDDYHLYELEVASGNLRQITFGLGFADYEPAYLPNGDLVFASTRCVQTVDCWWTEVSNLYTCDPEGRFLRRLGFDQVHTVFPTVLGDGRVIYTRWDYNDRGQVFPQALFQMNADGTAQSEFYGNNSWFPTTIAHARGIPGTQKVAAVLCGHHSSQAGKLAVIDLTMGRQEETGVQLIAPVRETRADRIDSYGQEGPLWQYPWPLNAREFLVAFAPRGWEYQSRENHFKGDAQFAVYWMDTDGRRELLASDPHLPCQQPVPLMARPQPATRPSQVDYRQTTGTYYVQDVYAGSGLMGVPRGTIKQLRVVALDFRAAGVGNNHSGGPGGGALISTPVAIGNGTWDVKRVLGHAKVHADGSAFFRVPARTPVYFQALDAHGHTVQTMRSWTTVQPGENQSCVGCHEHKNSAPPAGVYPGGLALNAGTQELTPFYGPPRGFSFPKEIQPILDRHCVRCHNDRSLHPETARQARAIIHERDPDWNTFLQSAAFKHPAGQVEAAGFAAATIAPDGFPSKPAFSLLADESVDRAAKRRWSDAYLNLTQAREDQRGEGSFAGTIDGRMVNWIGSQSVPAPLPPYSAGACQSGLFALLARGHYGVQLTREELDKLACWIDLLVPYCGDYTEANAWSEADRRKYDRYVAKRKQMEEVERRNIEEFLAHQDRKAQPPTGRQASAR